MTDAMGSHPNRSPLDRTAQLFQLASAVLAEMQMRGIAPSPSNYEIWLTYRSGSHPALIRRMGDLLQQGATFTQDLLEALRLEFVTGVEVDLEAISGGSDAIQDAAQALVAQVTASQSALACYGDVLEHWASHLDEAPGLGDLIQAVGALAAETTKAAERNRVLESQLAASVVRISKLRQSLAEVKQEATTDKLTGLSNRRPSTQKSNA